MLTPASARYVPSLSLIALLCLIALTSLPKEATAAMAGLEVVPVEGPKGIYAVTLPDGRLMMWYTQGKGETDPEVINDPDIPQTAFVRYSSDNGYTWTEPELLFEFPRERGAYFGQVMLVDRDENIHLFGLHFFGYDLEDYDNWDAYESYAFHTMSSDGGKTWTRSQHCDFGHKYTGMTNSVIQLKSGRILLPVSYYSKRKTGRFVSNLSLSDDSGKTWRPSRGECVVDTGGAGLESGGCEPVVIELNDGRVWMMIRTQGGYQYESVSADGGDTWTEPAPSRFVSSNSPGSLLRLRDGRMVFIWNNCMGPAAISYDRQILHAAISDDDGKTWSGYREIARVGPDRGVATYPFLTQAADGAIICLYAGGSDIIRVQPDWLTETTARDDFAEGLANWMTYGAEGPAAIAHPDRAGHQVLALRKPNPEVPAGASFNFPFGVQGHLTVRLRLEPGFQGARLCLTDFFSLPGHPEDGRFGISISPNGELSVATAPGQSTPTAATLEAGKWHTLGFAWDCEEGTCGLTVNYEKVADLPQLSPAAGICYLRLWSAAEQTDEAGMLVESVSTRSAP